MSTSSPPSTGESSQPTLDTTYMAATRTLLALMRTGAAIAGGGALATDLLVKGWPRWVVIALSSAFVVLGYWMMWSALKKGRELRVRLELADRGFVFSHREFMVMTVVLQLLIAIVVALYLIGQGARPLREVRSQKTMHTLPDWPWSASL